MSSWVRVSSPRYQTPIRNVSAVFVADIGLDTPLVAGGDDAAEARWWFADELPPEMAFDHADIIAAALRRLDCL